MADVNVLGRKSSRSVADSILSSPSLNASPSPSKPDTMPVDGLMQSFTQLYAAAVKIRTLDTDMARKTEIERIVQFADSTLESLANSTRSAGPPVPSGLEVAPPPPPPQPSPQAGPGPNPVGPGPNIPGAPASPPAGPMGPPPMG